MRTTRPRSSSSPARAFSNLRSSRHPATVLVAMVLLSLCAAAPSSAQPDPAYLAAPPGFKPKDFTILRDGAWYHAFYIETVASDVNDTGTRLGHSRSADLWHWEFVDSIFGPGTAAFDNQRVWAPHLVKVSGVYYLFYTGVSNDAATPNHQSIGVATSTDLTTWNRLSAPIIDCSIAANSECLPNVSGGGQLRDPFVMADPTTPGRWVTYYSTVFDGGQFMTAGMATTSSALSTTPWADAGITWTPSSTPPFNTGQVESPHLFVHDGLWYLLYTSNVGPNFITVWTNATAPIGAEGSWQMRGQLDAVLGYSSYPWFASEKFDDVDGNEYFGVVSDLPSPRRIQIRRLTWTPGDWKFHLATPPAGITAIGWDTETGTESVITGQYANLVFTSGAFQGRKAHIEIVEHDAGQPDQILPPGSLGLNADIDLTGTSTTFHWTSQGMLDDDSTPNRLEIQVRLANDPSVVSPLLYINSPPSGDHDPYRDGAFARQAREEGGTGGLAPAPPVTLRVLQETPLGAGIGLLVDLAAATEARVEIFDLAGRRLRTISNGVMAKGATVLLWDGRDDAGRLPPAGIVFARLSTPREAYTARLVVGAGSH
jgi:hypothetical protein